MAWGRAEAVRLLMEAALEPVPTCVLPSCLLGMPAVAVGPQLDSWGPNGTVVGPCP